MKKTILISTLALLLFSCGKTEDKTIESILASKNIAQISAKKSELQAQIAKLEEALKALDTINEEALVAVQPVKDTVFSHYLEVQGNIDTKDLGDPKCQSRTTGKQRTSTWSCRRRWNEPAIG